jgi:hypothetical protein
MEKFHVIDSQSNILFTGTYQECKNYTNNLYLLRVKNAINDGELKPVTTLCVGQNIVISPKVNSPYGGKDGYISRIENNKIYVCIPALDGLVLEMPKIALYEKIPQLSDPIGDYGSNY